MQQPPQSPSTPSMTTAAAAAPGGAAIGRFNPGIVEIRTGDVQRVLRRFLPQDHDRRPPPEPRCLDVYREAMVHRSYAVGVADVRDRLNRECPPGCVPLQKVSYDRLEYLGDAVLGVVIASYLFQRYPSEDEGFLTRMRSHLVNGRTLAQLFKRTTLSRHVVSADGSATASVLEDVLEAFIGAIFVDLGYETARDWILGLYEAHVDFGEIASNLDTPISVLNRHFMQTTGSLPRVEHIDHTAVRVVHPNGIVISTGRGKNAADIAIKKAIQWLGRERC